MSLVFVDSSAFLSLEDASERSHDRCREAFLALVADRARFVTTNFVFDETYTLLLVRLGRDRAVAWGTSFRASQLVGVVRVASEHEERAWEILIAYDDKDFSYTDATSLAVAENLGVDVVFTVDRHFRQYAAFSIVP